MVENHIKLKNKSLNRVFWVITQRTRLLEVLSVFDQKPNMG